MMIILLLSVLYICYFQAIPPLYKNTRNEWSDFDQELTQSSSISDLNPHQDLLQEIHLSELEMLPESTSYSTDDLLSRSNQQNPRVLASIIAEEVRKRITYIRTLTTEETKYKSINKVCKKAQEMHSYEELTRAFDDLFSKCLILYADFNSELTNELTHKSRYSDLRISYAEFKDTLEKINSELIQIFDKPENTQPNNNLLFNLYSRIRTSIPRFILRTQSKKKQEKLREQTINELIENRYGVYLEACEQIAEGLDTDDEDYLNKPINTLMLILSLPFHDGNIDTKKDDDDPRSKIAGMLDKFENIVVFGEIREPARSIDTNLVPEEYSDEDD